MKNNDQNKLSYESYLHRSGFDVINPFSVINAFDFIKIRFTIENFILQISF